MKRPGVDGDFVLCFLLNLIFNAFGAIPAIVLLVAHFVAGVPLWLAGVALVLWIAIVFGITAFLNWATSKTNSSTSQANRVTTHFASEERHRPENWKNQKRQ